MKTSQKIKELQGIIKDTLKPLINSNYVLLDVPYYTNIGDTLIWEGTKDFLKELPYKCLYQAAVETYKYHRLPKDCVILMQGGGNFGDLWRRHQELRLSVVQSYPDNRIIILPQTVFYNDIEILKKDAAILNSHKDLHICVRDTKSHELLQQHLTCRIYLTPDMAFCISEKTLLRSQKGVSEKILLLKRNDPELSNYKFNSYIKETPDLIDTCDWPTMEKHFATKKYLDKLLFRKHQLGRIPDIYADHIFRPFQVRKGVEFVSRYKKVYTTRLHVAILSYLLNKDIVFFDNSYGKNSSFFDTWLKDAENIEFIR